MKFHKIIAILIVVMLIISSLPVSAAQDRKLTLERAVQISDTQIVLVFSEPVAINLEQENRGPFCCIRLVNSSGGTTRADREDVISPYYRTILQWEGFLQFIDEKHDRMVWTIGATTCGINNVTDIVNHTGVLSNYADRRVAFVIEEVPYDEGVINANLSIDNITTADGKVHLFPTYPTGWERATVPLTQDFSYKIDESLFEGIDNVVNIEAGLIEKGEYVDVAPQENVEEIVQNNPVIVAVIMGGCAILGGAILVFAVVGKKRKAE